MLDESLLKIGFNKREATVYLEMLKIGPQPASVIANRTHLNRTTTYSILKALTKKGVISSYQHVRTKVFAANDPNSLVGYVDRRCQTFKYYRSEILGMVNEFRGLNTDGEYNYKRPLVRFFDGLEGVKHVMNDALDSRGLIKSYMALHKYLDKRMTDFVLRYKDWRIFIKEIMLKAIVPDTYKVRAFLEDNYDPKSEMTEILLTDDKKFVDFFENQINIYDDRVSIMHFDEGEEYGVIIESEEIAAMNSALFDMVWRGVSVGNNRKKK